VSILSILLLKEKHRLKSVPLSLDYRTHHRYRHQRKSRNKEQLSGCRNQVLVSEKNASGSPVFYDPRGRRWKHVRRTYLAIGIAATVLAAIFISSVLANPWLPTPNLRSPYLPRTADLKPQTAPQIPTAREAKSEKGPGGVTESPVTNADSAWPACGVVAHRSAADQ
jgi:hypothetical protein